MEELIDINLYEIYDEKHIIIFAYESLIYWEVLEDLSLSFLDSIFFIYEAVQILKHSNDIVLVISQDRINSISIKNDTIIKDKNLYTKVDNHPFSKGINLPDGKIAICTEDSYILIYKIFSDKFSLQTKIGIGTNFPISLFYIEKTNELLIRMSDQILFLNLKKYTFYYKIEQKNYYLWGSNYDKFMGKYSMENNFCMINDYLLAMFFQLVLLI